MGAARTRRRAMKITRRTIPWRRFDDQSEAARGDRRRQHEQGQPPPPAGHQPKAERLRPLRLAL